MKTRDVLLMEMMERLSRSITFWNLLLCSIPAVYCQSFLNLTSSPLDLSTVYPDQPIVFTCSTRDTPILTWSSNEYIGEGGILLEFLTIHSPGFMLSGQHGAYAVLTRVVSTEPLELVSEFRINASTLFPRPTVTCNGVGTNTTASIGFNVTNISSITLTSSLDSTSTACPGQVLQFTCTTLDSPILAWSSATYIGGGGIQFEFLSLNNVGTMITSAANPQTSAVLTSKTSSSEGGGVNVLVSNLTLTVVEDTSGRGQTVTCINVGVGTRAVFTIQVADNCDATTSAGTNSTTSVGGEMTSSDGRSTSNGSSLVGLTQCHVMTIITATIVSTLLSML